MYIDIYWIDIPVKGKIGIMPRPRGGDWLEDEISRFKNDDVGVIASLLTLPEVTELQLLQEESLCRKHSITFYSVPVEDRCTPESIFEIYQVVQKLNKAAAAGYFIAIHCRQGIGRSSLLAASVLTSLGLSATEAFRRIELSRGREVPDTIEQKQWVQAFAEFCSQFC